MSFPVRMHLPPTEYLDLPLRAHDLLREVPLYDVSCVDLPAGGAGRTLADVRELERSAPASRVATILYRTRQVIGRVFRWDLDRIRPDESLVSQLSERDRRESTVSPGSPDGDFLVIYRFSTEELRETRNATVHGFICTALAQTVTGYRLYWGVYVLHTSWLTSPYLLVIEPLRRLLYPAMLRRIRRAWIATYGSEVGRG